MSIDESPKKKRTAGGIATSNVIVSAHVAGNAEVFAQVLDLHVPLVCHQSSIDE